MREFPEVDAAEWFDEPTARTRIVAGQLGVLDAWLELTL
jgi:predicted NUDIX family NTP pyrophosphohydrolase